MPSYNNVCFWKLATDNGSATKMHASKKKSREVGEWVVHADIARTRKIPDWFIGTTKVTIFSKYTTDVHDEN